MTPEHISDDRLAEMRDTYKTAPNLSSALLELQERRKAEGERKKEYGIRGPYRVNGPFPQAEVDAHMRMYPNAKPVWRYAAGEWLGIRLTGKERKQNVQI